MLTNPLLSEMSTNDLQQRYVQTFVKYDDEILYIANITREELIATTRSGSKCIPFDPRKLDVSRPCPRWLGLVDDSVYYLSYRFDKQYHRGFCAGNTSITGYRPGNELAKRRIRFPGMCLFDVIDNLYKKELTTLKCSVRDIEEGLKVDKYMLLSPQVMLIDDGSKLTPHVYFRERNLGRFGAINPLFVQELKELVGDYKNEDNAWDVPSVKGKAEKMPVGRKIRVGDVEVAGRAGFDDYLVPGPAVNDRVNRMVRELQINLPPELQRAMQEQQERVLAREAPREARNVDFWADEPIDDVDNGMLDEQPL